MNDIIKTKRPRKGAIVDSVFRALSSLIFVVAGWGHLQHPETFVPRLVASRIGAFVASIAPAELLVVATGAVMLAAGLALLFGVKTKLAALALMACLVPITLSVQLAPGQTGPLFKNVALFGMLLHFASSGARGHALSIDAHWVRRPAVQSRSWGIRKRRRGDGLASARDARSK